MKYKVAILVLLLLQAFSSLAQCPMCRTAVETARKGSNSKVGAGLNDGILYLLVLPYLLIGVIGYLWYKRYKAHKANTTQQF